jgi:hypothetical protein
MFCASVSSLTVFFFHSVELSAWQDHLGPDVADSHSSRRTMLPHRLMLHISYWWLHILLHRPFYRPVRPIHMTGKKIDHIKVRLIFSLGFSRHSQMFSCATEPQTI